MTLANHPTEQKSDLGWGSIKYDEPRVYATALALRVLSRGNYKKTPQFIKAKNWLMMTRNEDGGWGEMKGSPSTFLHTAHTLIALSNCGIDPRTEILSKGCDWLLNLYDPSNLWNDFNLGGLMEYVDISAQLTQRVTYLHFTTPWVINALIKCKRINTIQVFKGINWIVDNCHNGYWDHPYLVSMKNKPMWAIHDSLLALKNFQAIFPHWDEIKQVILQNGEITIKPISKARLSITKYFKRFSKNKITWGCFGIISIFLFLVIFKILPVREGILGILIPFLIAIVANLITKESRYKKSKR
ncbi:MAG: prenyltransferase/squalene oxidase repeat-containing protein [bacterium]